MLPPVSPLRSHIWTLSKLTDRDKPFIAYGTGVSEHVNRGCGQVYISATHRMDIPASYN